jgi:hypothetical protein
LLATGFEPIDLDCGEMKENMLLFATI